MAAEHEQRGEEGKGGEGLQIDKGMSMVDKK
jgi:hypothetical protein